MKEELILELASFIAALVFICAFGFVVWCINWYADSYAQFSGAIQ